MTWACCVYERVSVHVASLVAMAWKSPYAWIWLLLTGEVWKSFNWPDCKGVKVSQPVMHWHMCLWNQSHVGTHICEISYVLAHICEAKHALAHMSMCLWNQSHVGTHVCEIDHALAHTSVKSVTHWHTSLWRGIFLGSIFQMGVMYTRAPAMYTWRDAHLHVGLGMPPPLGKWCGACFFSLLWIWIISFTLLSCASFCACYLVRPLDSSATLPTASILYFLRLGLVTESSAPAYSPQLLSFM